jgi:hypothetical protein
VAPESPRGRVRAKQTPSLLPSGDAEALELDDLTNMSDRHSAWVNSGPAPGAKPLTPTAFYRSDRELKSETQETRLRRRLEKVSDAWIDFQENRARDAVYGYLKAVFALVVEHKGHRRTKRLLRRAFEFGGLPFDKNADPFAAVIRCTSERGADNKTISKWARALRYAAHCKKPRTGLKLFMKKMGGINACADRYTRYLGRGTR